MGINKDMAEYIFDSEVVFPAKASNPPSPNATPNGVGVTYEASSGTYYGGAYDTLQVGDLATTTTSVTANNNIFTIDNAYNGQVFALLDLDGSHEAFIFESGTTTPTLTGVTAISDPTQRREYLLGYI